MCARDWTAPGEEVLDFSGCNRLHAPCARPRATALEKENRELHRSHHAARADARSPVVPPRGVLRGHGPLVRRQQRRRLGRHRRAHLQARLPAVARDRRPLAATVLPVPAARRRLRRLGLQGDPARVRDHRRVPRPGHEGARAQHAHHHRPPDEPHLRPARVVPAIAQRSGGTVRRLLRLERDRRQVAGHPHHLRRHRGLQLGVRRGPAAVLLPPLLLAPARPQFR